MSCGELSEGKCLESIKPFLENGVILQTVKNVFPQVMALNQMIEQCNTQWLIPVDADMILYDDAWDRISNAWRKHWRNSQWHSILFPLWDTLTERRILALKLMRTSIAKENMFKESATPDVEHYQRLTSRGYVCIQDYLKQKPIGDHVVIGKHFCYHKYRDVYQTYRSHNFEWDSGAFMGGDDLRSRAKAHFDYFLPKWILTDNADYLWCIAGMMDGILSPVENRSKTLENRDYYICKEYAIEAFLKWYTQETIMYRDGVLF
jgi:glycosyltransferase involved in cell wall biosynthesis